MKARLKKLALERAAVQEKLERTDDSLKRGAETMLAYLDLLAHPAVLYDRSPDSVRRQLLEIFFSDIFAHDESDAIAASGIQNPAIAQLTMTA